jgi:hypothetical protein
MTLANRGRALERALDTAHAFYASSRRASVVRIPTPYKVLGHAGRSGGSLICVPEHQGEPDYHVQIRGLSLLMDAKECAAGPWPLAHLPANQAERFDSHTAQGGFAFVLLDMEHRAYLLPWGVPENPGVGLAGCWHRAEAIRAGREPRPGNGWASLGHADCAAMGRLVVGYQWVDLAVGMCASPSRAVT